MYTKLNLEISFQIPANKPSKCRCGSNFFLSAVDEMNKGKCLRKHCLKGITGGKKEEN